MKYKLLKKDVQNLALLIKADKTELWIDYWETENGIEWDFNQYIFCDYSDSDQLVKETQNKIYEDVENFSSFIMDCFN